MIIADLCKTLEHGDRKRVTLAMKNLEKNGGRFAEHFRPEEADAVFRLCRNLMEQPGASELQIESALRLLRFTVLTFPFLVKRVGDLFGILHRHILHTHGNICQASQHLADKMSFALSCLLERGSQHPDALSEETIEGLERTILEGYLELLKMDEAYCHANPKLRGSRSVEAKIGFYQAAKSPQLRALRQAILCLNRLGIEQSAERFGMTLPITFSDPEEVDFQDFSFLQCGGKDHLLYQIKIQAMGLNPAIARTVILPADATFYAMHLVIQDLFSFDDSHLFAFRFKRPVGFKPLSIEPEYARGGEGPWGMPLSAEGTQLKQQFHEKKDTCEYNYDFGDDWTFTVTLQKILESDDPRPESLPWLLKAQGPNLLEDCGGPWGFADILSLYWYLLQSPKDRGKILDESDHSYRCRTWTEFSSLIGGILEPDWKRLAWSDPDARLKARKR
ncbi:hypothetical protein COU77_02405 [Candidatus Peregrinibacteria bacterium CG10_big_fil_rev_8_21_14_0_10_49_16]|nr:MAG: hypothetical protein COW95_00890 [Candidatus Peregrinibacteria bacterium CG22_combo_CG10-13_8_21_14_all_49_11]PIR52062.1 MAG: hypothetical protein COU77_02405 [Candidatus Peregrinibacteria bacterium CG10_big_fil_rev_8_21_14_0_10_49_16]